MKENVVADLLSRSPDMQSDVVVFHLSKRLEENLGFDKDIARWAVESWGLALSKSSSAEVQQPQNPTALNQPQDMPTSSMSISTISNTHEPSVLQAQPAAEPQGRSRFRLFAAVATTVLLAVSGVLGYQHWMQKLEAQKAEDESLRQAEQAKKVAQEQVREAAIKAEEVQRQAKVSEDQERQERVKVERQRVQQARIEGQKRELELQERLERVRLENQQRQQELKEKQEQARVEAQRRQQEFREKQQQAQLEAKQRQQEQLDKQRELQLQRQQEAQERAAQQQQQRILQQGLDILRRATK